MSTVMPKQFRLNGWHVLGGMTVFFLIVICLDVLFATLAYRAFSGQVASNPYEAGLAYNRTITQRQEQAALGWSVEVDAAGLDEVVLVWRGRDGAPLEGLRITGDLTRPATDRGQQEITFAARGDGRYAASAELASGGWDLKAEAVAPGGERFEIIHRIMIP